MNGFSRKDYFFKVRVYNEQFQKTNDLENMVIDFEVNFLNLALESTSYLKQIHSGKLT